MLDLIALCLHVFFLVLMALIFAACSLVWLHDIMTGRYRYWGRLLNSRPDQFQDGR
jgi:hypothetical protein